MDWGRNAPLIVVAVVRAEGELAGQEGLEVLLLQLQQPGGGGVEVYGLVGGDAHLSHHCC